jgi:hypothetical protein
MLLGAAFLIGCEQALFPKDLPRSPYERYLALRGQLPPASRTNPYGVQEPALRDRLRPMDQR